MPCRVVGTSVTTLLEGFQGIAGIAGTDNSRVVWGVPGEAL